MTIDPNDPLFSLSHRREVTGAGTPSERTAEGQRERVLARLLVASKVGAAQEKITAAEDAAALPRRQVSGQPPASPWQRLVWRLGGAPLPPSASAEPSRSTAAVEVAKAQLKRLIEEDGPTFIRHADEVAAAIEARVDGGKAAASRRSGRPEKREALVKEERSP